MKAMFVVFKATFVILCIASLIGCDEATNEVMDNGGEASHGEGGGEGEESGTQYLKSDTYDEIRNGARLILNYDAGQEAFIGTVTNTTNATLTRVRVEVHLSNGVELGPTTPKDLAPAEVMDVRLDAAGQVFNTWGAHPEVGSGSGDSGEQGEGGGEHGGQGEGDGD